MAGRLEVVGGLNNKTLDSQKPLRVCLDARLLSGRSGGVEQAIISLADGLRQLDGPERYYFLTYANHQDWLRPYLSGPCRLLVDTAVFKWPTMSPWKRKFGQLFPQLLNMRQGIKRAPQKITLPRSSGVIEKAGIDVMHFTKQSAFLTAVPSVYQPWDLLHCHYPNTFTADVLARRDASYRAYCRQAAIISVASPWVKADLIKQFQTAAEKIEVIPIAPPLDAYPPTSSQDLQEIKQRYALPPAFAFYPAQPYPHKNHRTLLQALAYLRDEQGLAMPLVCTGLLNDYYFTTIQPLVRTLGLSSQVSFLGFVDVKTMASLYRLARMLVFPSIFEGWGLPVLEAFQVGLPVAASTATTLPGLVGDTGLLFDPQDPLAMARAISVLWGDEVKRKDLVERGRQRVKEFSTGKTAVSFRSLYRQLATQTGDRRA